MYTFGNKICLANTLSSYSFDLRDEHMNKSVLILGAIPRIAVPIARSLANIGISVTVASFGRGEFKIVSKAIKEFLRMPDPQKHKEMFLNKLEALLMTDKFDMLIPLGDEALKIVSEIDDWLRSYIYLACPPPHILKRVLDKKETLAAAERCGISTPKEFFLCNDTILQGSDCDLTFPLILKPVDKREISCNKFKILHINDIKELQDLVTKGIVNFENILVQEFIPGIGLGVEVLMHLKQPVASFLHQRVREFPYTGGVSAVAVSVELKPHLFQQAVDLLRELDWEGVAMVEFRYDPNTGRSALMEVNGRYWGSLSLSIQSGVDFALLEWQLAHGGAGCYNIAQYNVGIRSRWFAGDLMRLHGIITDANNEKLPWSFRINEIIKFARDFNPSCRDMLWSWTDPAPWFQEIFQVASGLIKSDIKAFAKILIPKRILTLYAKSKFLDGPARSIYLRLQLLRTIGMRVGLDRKIPPGARSFLFVCQGNIIRSPMAEHLFASILENTKHNDFIIKSAGLYSGCSRDADHRAIEVAKNFGVSLEKHKSQVLTNSLINSADVIFIMDYFNEARIISSFPGVRNKLYFLGSSSDLFDDNGIEIKDPYFGGTVDILHCFDQIRDCLIKCSKDICHQ